MNAKSTFEDVVTTGTLTDRPANSLPTPQELATHGDAKIIAIFNQKGGVGKTTTTINLGAALVELGRRVLLVDFDPQGGMTLGLGVRGNDLPKEETVLSPMMDPNANPEEIVLKSSLPGLDFLPANRELGTIEALLGSEIGSQFFLKRVLAPLQNFYDVILIDCQPTMGQLAINALVAAKEVIVPLQCEWFSLNGFIELGNNLQKVRQSLNPDLKLVGVLATMYDRRAVHNREVLGRMLEQFPEDVFETIIGKTIRFSETSVKGEPITQYATNSDAANSYRRLARELIARGGAK